MGHKSIPTWEGKRFIDYAKEISSLEKRLNSEIIGMKNDQNGQIRFALPMFRSTHLLPQIIPKFRERYPNIDIVVVESASQAFETLLVTGEIDFAIVNTVPKRPDVITQVIHRYDYFLAVPLNHPLANAGILSEDSPYPKIDIRLFKDDGFILQKPEQLTRHVADYVFAQTQITPKVLFTLRNIEASAALVTRGCGVCFLPGTYLQYLDTSGLQCFSLINDIPQLELGIAYMKGFYMPEYFKYFVDIVMDII